MSEKQGSSKRPPEESASIDEIGRGVFPERMSNDDSISASDPLDMERVQRALAFIESTKEPGQSANTDTPKLVNSQVTLDADHVPLLTDADKYLETVGRFQLERLIGEGGFAKVWLAYDPTLERRVAIKLLKPSAFFSKEVLVRFEREAKAVACLSHPNIVPVFETGIIEADAYLVAGYCQGTNLEQWIKEESESVDPTIAALICRKLADAVEHAHQRGIVHRDLKPANILVEDNQSGSATDIAERLRITDFGLAKQLKSTDQEQTTEGAILGTPNYMSPEQAGGSGSVDHRADIYSLGVILYELLTGTIPHRRTTHVDTLIAIRNEPIKAPRGFDPSIPKDLEAICLKCVRKEPSHRYATAHELSQDLLSWLNGEVITARRVTPVERFGKWVARNSLLTAGVVLLTAALGFAVWQWNTSLRNLSVAESESTRAQGYLSRLTGIIDVFLTDIEHVDEPTLISYEQRERLNEILTLQQSLIDSQDKNPSVTTNTLRAYLRVAKIQNALGNHKEAAISHQEARTWLEQTNWRSEIAEENVDDKFAYLAIELQLDEIQAFGLLHQQEEAMERLEVAQETLDQFEDSLSKEQSLLFHVEIENLWGNAHRARNEHQAKHQRFLDAAEYGQELLNLIDSEITPHVGVPIAATRARLAQSYRENLEHPKALAMSIECEDLLNQCLEVNPDDYRCRRILSKLLTDRMFIYKSKKIKRPPDQPLSDLERSILLSRSLHIDVPDNPDYQIELARSLSRHANFIAKASPELALEELDESIELTNGIRDQTLRANASFLRAMNNKAYLLSQNDRVEEALETSSNAIEQANAFLIEDPDYYPVVYELTSLWQKRMGILWVGDMHQQFVDEAPQCYAAIDVALNIKEAVGYRRTNRQFLAAIRGMESTQLAHLKRWDEAIAKVHSILEVERIVDGEARRRYVSAATAMGRLANIWSEKVDERGQEFDEACRVAIEWLRVSVTKHGYKNVQAMKNSTDFDIFRTYAEFENVIALMTD